MKQVYPNIENCDPRQCVSGRMMRCSRIVSSIFRKYLKPFDITNSQLSIMFMITKSQGIKQQDIANWLYMDKSTVNRNLKRLFDKELIVKFNGTIETTTIGKNQLEQIIPEWDKAMKEINTILKKEGMESVNKLTQILTT